MIAAIIATKDRPYLLKSRALASLYRQTLSPDFIIVVDDSLKSFQVENQAIISKINFEVSDVVYLKNQKTAGASGAWNTAIEYIFDNIQDPSSLFLAFLDDDDMWEPTYLSRVYQLANEADLHLVSTAFLRKETANDLGIIQYPPCTLFADDFLIGNPGIQGSNLFVRMDVMLHAGQFDESLLSCTDRDLCIRISDLGYVKYQSIMEPLMFHFAENDRIRLSTPLSVSKNFGLDVFYKKYSLRMTKKQNEKFIQRTVQLFNWKPKQNVTNYFNTLSKIDSKINATLLLFFDSNQLEFGQELIQSFFKIHDESLLSLDFVLCDLSKKKNTSLENKLLKWIRRHGFGCYTLTTFVEPISKSVAINCMQILLNSRNCYMACFADLFNLKGEYKRSFNEMLKAIFAEKITYNNLTLSVDNNKVEEWLLEQRIKNSQAHLTLLYPINNLRVLGFGDEAIIFTDEKSVFKCMDFWKRSHKKDNIDFIKENGSHWYSKGLYPLEYLSSEGCFFIIKYPYEESSPYEGEHEDKMFDLLFSCEVNNFVCNNLHPKNLILTSSEIKLIDYGSDIKRYTPFGFEHMLRRAFLTVYYSRNKNINSFMRKSLTQVDFPEMSAYSEFKDKYYKFALSKRLTLFRPTENPYLSLINSFSFFIGIISSEPYTVAGLLEDLYQLSFSKIFDSFHVLILNNAASEVEFEVLIRQFNEKEFDLKLISRNQQIKDSSSGYFGNDFNVERSKPSEIAEARTMLQRYIGEKQKQIKGSISWILDDDMRLLPDNDIQLSYLPLVKKQGVDVLIGQYAGSSPNPPLNGLRVQLLDLYYNLRWLNGLSPDQLLPNRGQENKALRERFPDYYYDLSRKHSAHLETPFWLEPIVYGETVKEARSRLILSATSLLSGEPLTRPILTIFPEDPIQALIPSVNRGGTTFIFNYNALLNTPNIAIKLKDRESRRSDMFWAIVNRYYHGFTIQTAPFPIYHKARAVKTCSLNILKVQSEIQGSALYAGMMTFLNSNPSHRLNFNREEIKEITKEVNRHLKKRLSLLTQSFYRIQGLVYTIRQIDEQSECVEFLSLLEDDYHVGNARKILIGASLLTEHKIAHFIETLLLQTETYMKTQLTD